MYKGNFLGLAPAPAGSSAHDAHPVAMGDHVYEHGSLDNSNQEVDEQNFEELLDHLDAKEVFEE